ncbi:TetR/AcrR family transcriptional regulator, partial [Streptomyces sp. 2MCAF27]
ADNHALRADLALSWMLGIGMMRVVVGKEPLVDADPDEVCALVMVALGTLLDGLSEMPGQGSAQGRGSVNTETSAL